MRKYRSITIEFNRKSVSEQNYIRMFVIDVCLALLRRELQLEETFSYLMK